MIFFFFFFGSLAQPRDPAMIQLNSSYCSISLRFSSHSHDYLGGSSSASYENEKVTAVITATASEVGSNIRASILLPCIGLAKPASMLNNKRDDGYTSIAPYFCASLHHLILSTRKLDLVLR